MSDRRELMKVRLLPVVPWSNVPAGMRMEAISPVRLSSFAMSPGVMRMQRFSARFFVVMSMDPEISATSTSLSPV